jgi:uncharacterized metal-binding protein YceD (DUF177 family)
VIETKIYVGDLRSHKGAHRDVHLEIPGESFSTNVAHIVDTVTCDLVLENASSAIVVRGTLSGNFTAQCSYGLVDFTESFSVLVNELFEERDHRRPHESLDDEEDSYSYSGDDIDIEDLMHDSISVYLPLAPACAHGPENCAVCSSEIIPFIAKDLPEGIVGGVDDVEPPKDNRWSALDDLKLEE